jgi:hypothetical protein
MMVKQEKLSAFLSRFRQSSIFGRVLASVVVLPIVLIAGYEWGSTGDCSFAKEGGECGLSTSVGLMGGLFVGFCFLLLVWMPTLLEWRKERMARKTLDAR